MTDIKTIDLPKLNNGAHYEFMKVVSDRFASETALSANAAAKKAIEALAAALKEEDRCLAISRKSLMTEDIRQARFHARRYLSFVAPGNLRFCTSPSS